MHGKIESSPGYVKTMNPKREDVSVNYRWIFLSAISLQLPFLLLYLYSYSSIEINLFGIVLKKITVADSTNFDLKSNSLQDGTKRLSFPWTIKVEFHSTPITPTYPSTLSYTLSHLRGSQDTVSCQESITPLGGLFYLTDTTTLAKVQKSDSSAQRILFMGDSQAGGLLHIFNDYCVENGHQIVAAHIWYSSTVLNYGYSGVVDEKIKQFQPTLIVIVLGMNELYAQDLDKRTQAANLLRQKFGNIPYLWIGPANFVEDKGINKVYQQIATSERYVLSKNLNIPRGSDKRHPNQDGYTIWMEHIAKFIQSSPLYNFKFDTPIKYGNRIAGKVTQANAAKDRGY
jgi:hypothetical protein